MRVWGAVVHVLTGLPVAVAGGVAMVVATVSPRALRRVVAWRTAAQRQRFAALLGVEIAEAVAVRRQAGYHLLAVPFSVAAFAVVAGAAWIGLAGLAVAPQHQEAGAAWNGLAVTPQHQVAGAAWNGLAVAPWHQVAGAAWNGLAVAPWHRVAGVGLVVVAVGAAVGLARLDAAMARRLLGPNAAEALAARLAELARGRSEAVAAADAERRRIERDLHDGTQQRLVTLAMTLGLARAELPDGPARDVVGQAHRQAKEALAELRDFVRGLHPAVLDDRGLDAALSGLVAGLPQPVELRVDVAGRCPPVIEGIAYFVVCEALTNATRHARAGRIEVAVVKERGRLRLSVADDGIGGAEGRPGGGLEGLAQRVASVDGTLRIASPPGGPTRVEVELPCGS